MNHFFDPTKDENIQPNDWPKNVVGYDLESIGYTSSSPSLAGYYSLPGDPQKEKKQEALPPLPPPPQRIPIQRSYITQREAQIILASIHVVRMELKRTQEQIRLLEIRSMLQIQLIINQRELDNLKRSREKL